jgi:hypothetical protein
VAAEDVHRRGNEALAPFAPAFVGTAAAVGAAGCGRFGLQHGYI